MNDIRERQVNLVADQEGGERMDLKAYIKVFGVGGAGCNAVNRMYASGVQNVEFYCVNTDQQQLEESVCKNRVRIGDKLTRGLGAGANPEIGEKAAEEAAEDLRKLVSDADMVFITAGMGGGTGTGAAPVLARIAKEAQVLTVAVVTKPFRFEGPGRMNHADQGIEKLKEFVDALIIVPNDKLLDIATEDTSLNESFAMADEILKYGVVGITDLVTVPGLINLDMMDVRRVMTDAGVCHMGIGRGKGPNAIDTAINDAIHSPLLDTSIDGARRLIVNFTGPKLRIKEFNEASTLVRDAASPDAEIIIGCVTDVDNFDDDEVMITVIASSFEPEGVEAESMMYRNDFSRSSYRPERSGRQAATDFRPQPQFQPESARPQNSRPIPDFLNTNASESSTAAPTGVESQAPFHTGYRQERRPETNKAPQAASQLGERRYGEPTLHRSRPYEESADTRRQVGVGLNSNTEGSVSDRRYAPHASTASSSEHPNSRSSQGQGTSSQSPRTRQGKSILPWFFNESDEDSAR